MLTGKYKGLREKIIEATPALIRTSSNLIRVGGTFFNSSTPIPSNISLSGSSTLVDLKGRTLLQNNGRLYDLEKGFTEVKIPGLQDIRYVETFGDEAILLGTGSGGTEILVKDVQEKEIHLAIPQITLE